MRVDIFNAEHYYDPTACAALADMERNEQERFPLVYVCSPYSGDIPKNIERARRYARFAFSQGKNPIVPHLHYTQFLDDSDPKQRDIGLRFAQEWLSLCEEIWVFGDSITNGMRHELITAQRHSIPVRCFNAACREKGGRIPND